jgi:hypothetical protein
MCGCSTDRRSGRNAINSGRNQCSPRTPPLTLYRIGPVMVRATLKLGFFKGFLLKSCPKCKRQLPRWEFYAHSQTKDGLQTQCKTCQKTHSSERHRKRWSNIKARVLNPAHKEYPNYGGRGIAMHPDWADSFKAFRDWIEANLGPCPAGHSLDRIDNGRGYEPGNLRWASAYEQTHNRREPRRTVGLRKAA